MRFATCFRPAMLVVGTLVIAGCPGDLTRPSPPSLQFMGNVAGAVGLGTIAITVTSNPTQPGAASLSASATVRVSSGFEVFDLTGTYDPSAHVLALSGSGWTVRGTLSDGVLRGTFAATAGSGVFIALGQGEGAEAVRTFCGDGYICSPNWVLQAALGVRGASVVGVVYSRALPDTLISFVGSYSTTDSSLLLVDPANPTGPPLATGRLWTNANGTHADARFLNACFWAGGSCR